MAEKKSLVEETLLQMKSLENVISENAKGILHSTMREEIGELVKESLKEAEDDESEDMETEMYEQDEVDMEDEESEDETDDMTDTEDDMEDEDELDMDDMDDEEESDMDMTMDDEDEEPIDLTNASDEEILKVFKGMGEEDGIIVKKDGNTVDLQDTNDDAHYKISLGEQFDDEMGMEDDEFGMSDMSMDDEEDGEGWTDISSDSEDKLSFDDMSDMGSEEDEGVVYEIVMDEEDESMEMDEEDESMEMDEEDESMEMEESWSDEEDESLEEGFKPKGKGIGKAKFQYKKTKGGFKETMKQGTKGVGMGKPKFEFKKGENMGGTNKIVKKTETKEASRTLGTGRRFGKHGLPKPKAAPRHLNVESVEREVKLLREKNEEYRKALNVFRSKLNEVAVFNSNLAYATRLFTEHSTTKQEKINILRRFDSVESLKESKSLYKIVKDELSSQGGNKLMKESIQEKIDRTPSSGSAANLIESKTYENPQFMRMKDLMSKMNIIK